MRRNGRVDACVKDLREAVVSAAVMSEFDDEIAQYDCWVTVLDAIDQVLGLIEQAQAARDQREWLSLPIEERRERNEQYRRRTSDPAKYDTARLRTEQLTQPRVVVR